MLDFHTKNKTNRGVPHYLGRPERRRLLLLVMLLGVVIILTVEAAKPKNWVWLWQLPRQADAQRQAAEEQDDEAVDSRAKPRPQSELEPGVIVAPAPPKDDLAIRKVFFKGVKPELLAKIQDNAPFRSTEHDAFFHLLKILAETDDHQLNAASSGPVGYVQLAKQPAEYRGELVTIQGLVHRVLHREPPPNAYGVEGYYQTIIQSPKQAEPIVVYCLELPEGFPAGGQVKQQVELTGFFFKRWLYLAGDGMRSAPLLLSRTLKWTPVVAAADDKLTLNIGSMVVLVVFALLVTLVFISYFVKRGPAGAPAPLIGRAGAKRDRSVLGLAKLKDLELAPEVGAALRQLAEQPPQSQQAADETAHDSSADR